MNLIPAHLSQSKVHTETGRSKARLRSPLHDIVLIDVLKNPAGSCRSPLGGRGNRPGIAEIQ